MGIFDGLKKLIFADGVGSTEQAPSAIVPPRNQGHSKSDNDAEPSFSDGEILAVQQRAEAIQRAFNESLVIANQSKSRGIREYRLRDAREKLTDLKNLANKFSFLHLKNLQAVEASIVGVEAETRALPYGETVVPGVTDFSAVPQPEPTHPQGERDINSGLNRQERHLYSANDERAIHESIQGFFRVINESIEIARKSKKLETKLSRLGVARDRLREAQVQASRFSLVVEGFNEAEAEINRIDQAIKTGTPTEIAGMLQIDPNPAFCTAARNLLKEATALKKEKKYVEACEKLREAYRAEGAENLMIEDRLRLPMYLQLAEKNDEGWDELNRLLTKYTDQFSQPRIAHQMGIFLRKENNETATNPVRVVSEVKSSPLEFESERRSVTTGELQNAPVPSFMADVCDGFIFSATLQLRTPLRVLLRHGERYHKNDGHQPQIAREPWEGIWLPKTKTWKELGGNDVPEMPAGRHASDVGPILPNDYLPFLIAVRSIVEGSESVEARRSDLAIEVANPRWNGFVVKHGGSWVVTNKFFPRFIEILPGLDGDAVAFLDERQLNTPAALMGASDFELLAIKGIGAAKLKKIREICAETLNPTSEYVELVGR